MKLATKQSAAHLAGDDEDAVCTAWVVFHERRAIIHLRTLRQLGQSFKQEESLMPDALQLILVQG